MKFKIPKIIEAVTEKLEAKGFEVFLVGGCVRDIIMGRKPKDWDVATNAKPEEIQKVFPDAVYENMFGTVGVKTGAEDENLKIVEVTTYRCDESYSDKRHPDSIKFADSIQEDLSRRDFTVNALALSVSSGETVDLFGGKKNIENKIIRTVGNPQDRFSEDALRLLRAPRFATQLDFNIEEDTKRVIKERAGDLRAISKERIRDELTKLIMSEHAARGIELLEKLGLLAHIIPELREGIDVGQNKHHIFTVFEHNVRSLDYAAKKNFALDVRLAALLHDIAKPKTKRGKGEDSTFYGHQVVGARMAVQILDRLRFSKRIVERVALLIREHMFVYDIGEVTDAGVRRLLRRVGPENIDDLFLLREADRIGSGVPKAQPYRLRHLKFMVDKVSRDPISVKMLKIDGSDIMDILKVEPGPQVGRILNAVMGEVLEDPKRNKKAALKKRVLELNVLSEAELDALVKRGLGSRDNAEAEIEGDIKKKHHVK